MSVLGFELEWFDSVSGILQTIYLKFFLDNNTIELLHNNSIFLKQIFYPDVRLEDLYIGNSITIYNRLMVVKKYANIATTQYLNAREVRFLIAINREGLNSTPRLLNLAKSYKLTLGRVISTRSNFSFGELSVSNGDSLIELIGLSVKDPSQFLGDVSRIGPSLSGIVAKADNISDFFITCKCIQTVPNSTLCLIKPHIVKSQQSGDILKAIVDDGRFQIVGLFSVHLTIPLAEELFDVYRGVLKTYTLNLEHICSAPCLAVMIVSRDDEYDTVAMFRDFTGPPNPLLAKTVRPNSLRAQFGIDNVKNAVHCTDLSEDGEMENQYIFETVANL